MQRLHDVARHDCIRELQELLQLGPELLDTLESNQHGYTQTVERMHVIINSVRDSYTQLVI